MGQLQEEETPIDQEIVKELLELTPDWWKEAVLEVRYSCDEGIERYAHVIWSPEGHREIVDASEKLFDATYRLGALFHRYGRHWDKAIYRARLLDTGDCDYAVDFAYY